MADSDSPNRPMAVKFSRVTRDLLDGEIGKTLNTQPRQRGIGRTIVDPRVKAGGQPTRLHHTNDSQASFPAREIPRDTLHRRSHSFDGFRNPSTSRSPSPAVVGADENRLMSPARTRNTPSPRTVKYNHPNYKPHKSASPINIISAKPRTSDMTTGYLSSSPRTSAERKMVLRELDELNDELAEIHGINDNIDESMAVIHLDDKYDAIRGNQPGDAKHIGTPPSATPPQARFKTSPRLDQRKAEPLSGVRRPVVLTQPTAFMANAVQPKWGSELSAFFGVSKPTRATTGALFSSKH